MPIYEYQCEACGEVFEVTQKISDKPLKTHPDCKSKKKDMSVKKLISSTSFQLKGTGWYVTDYKKSSAPKEEAAPKVEDTKKDDAKPVEAKAEPVEKTEKKPAKKSKKSKSAA